MSKQRKPIAAYAVPVPEGSTETVVREVVVCDDGSVWTRSGSGAAWQQDAPIPGTWEEARQNGAEG